METGISKEIDRRLAKLRLEGKKRRQIFVNRMEKVRERYDTVVQRRIQRMRNSGINITLEEFRNRSGIKSARKAWTLESELSLSEKFAMESEDEIKRIDSSADHDKELFYESESDSDREIVDCELYGIRSPTDPEIIQTNKSISTLICKGQNTDQYRIPVFGRSAEDPSRRELKTYLQNTERNIELPRLKPASKELDTGTTNNNKLDTNAAIFKQVLSSRPSTGKSNIYSFETIPAATRRATCANIYTADVHRLSNGQMNTNIFATTMEKVNAEKHNPLQVPVTTKLNTGVPNLSILRPVSKEPKHGTLIKSTLKPYTNIHLLRPLPNAPGLEQSCIFGPSTKTENAGTSVTGQQTSSTKQRNSEVSTPSTLSHLSHESRTGTTNRHILTPINKGSNLGEQTKIVNKERIIGESGTGIISFGIKEINIGQNKNDALKPYVNEASNSANLNKNEPVVGESAVLESLLHHVMNQPTSERSDRNILRQLLNEQSFECPDNTLLSSYLDDISDEETESNSVIIDDAEDAEVAALLNDIENNVKSVSLKEKKRKSRHRVQTKKSGSAKDAADNLAFLEAFLSKNASTTVNTPNPKPATFDPQQRFRRARLRLTVVQAMGGRLYGE